jgi:hypothetical protein
MNRRMLAVAGLLSVAPASAGDDDRAQRWREDLDFLARELPARHKNLYHTLPREEWEARVAELRERIPELEDHEIAADFARLVASAGDSHTTVQMGSSPFVGSPAPIELRWFPDGLRVVAVPSEHADLVGGRVVEIGGVAVEEAWTRASEVIAHENEIWVRAKAPSWLAVPAFLRALGLADADEFARYVVETEPGKRSELDVKAGALARSLARSGPQESPPWFKRRHEPYWFEYLPDSRTLYLQYNQCADDPQRPFAKLVEELLAAADRERPDRFVVDLRHNAGGNSMVIAPLFQGLGARRFLRGRGRLYAILGPNTFSSGMMNAIQLREGYGALLVGEPTGGKPNSYGEVRTFELPNSKLRVGYCTKYFRDVRDDPPALIPELSAPLTFEDWKAGRDPALVAILAAR